MPSILLVDDETDLLSMVDASLRQAGFETLLATSGAKALEHLHHGIPDLVLLDLNLPDIPGTEICRIVKSDPRTRRVPVVMVTARCEETDRIVGFELGADDYVTKPFSLRELVLRVRALLRRTQGCPAVAPCAPRDVGPIRVDVEAHRVYVQETELALTPLEFELLVALASRAGRVLTRQQLLAEVWQITSESARTVDTHVKRLREKLGPARDQLETVRGVGYRLAEPATPK